MDTRERNRAHSNFQAFVPTVKRLMTYRELLPDAPVLPNVVPVTPAFDWGGSKSYVYFSDGSLRLDRAKVRGKSVRRIWKRAKQHIRRERIDQMAAYVRRQPA